MIINLSETFSRNLSSLENKLAVISGFPHGQDGQPGQDGYHDRHDHHGRHGHTTNEAHKRHLSRERQLVKVKPARDREDEEVDELQTNPTSTYVEILLPISSLIFTLIFLFVGLSASFSSASAVVSNRNRTCLNIDLN